MTKIIYPEDGIYEYCQKDIEDADNKLRDAHSKASFDIPPDFIYRSYLQNLQSMLQGYYQENANIKAKIKSTDARFEKMAEDLDSETNKMVFSKIKERDRLIK